MDESTEYGIQELCEKSGLPRRTIHFYTQQGILPPPRGAGLGATYNENHLLRLKLIPILRTEGLRLDQIRDFFRTAAAAVLREKLAHVPQEPAQSLQLAASVKSYTHYSIPGGILIIVPTKLPDLLHKKVERLLREAEKIFREESSE